jgi:hypothetical protein
VHKMRAIIQLSQLLCRWRCFHFVYRIYGLTRGQMMGGRSNAADSRYYTRHFLNWHSLNELFKTAQFWNLEIAVGHASIISEENVNFSMSFESCNGINRNAFHRTFLGISDAGIPNRLKLRMGSRISSMIRWISVSSLASITEAIADMALAPWSRTPGGGP